MLDIGDKLREMRKKRGKTQQQMADKLEINVKTWRDYEKNVSEIGIRKLIRASAYCRVNPTSLFESFIKRTLVIKGQQTKMMITTMKIKMINQTCLHKHLIAVF